MLVASSSSECVSRIGLIDVERLVGGEGEGDENIGEVERCLASRLLLSLDLELDLGLDLELESELWLDFDLELEPEPALWLELDLGLELGVDFEL